MDARFSPFSDEHLAEPNPAFRELREATPSFFSSTLGMWVVTRYRDCASILSDTERFSSDNSQDSIGPICPEASKILLAGLKVVPTMPNLDLPEHSRIRKINVQTFSNRRIAAMEPRIRELASGMVGDLVSGDDPDFIADVAFPLPIQVIFSMLGFPDEDAEMLKGWTSDWLTLKFGHPSVETQVQVSRSMTAFWAYCEQHADRRSRDRSDDFTSALLDVHDADPKQISMQELTSVTFGLSIAGHETTTNMMAQMLVLLMRNRTAWHEICADPSLIPNAVEESMRYDSGVNSWRRRARVDVDLGEGVVLPAGADVLVLMGSANRDPREFDDPELFDIHRQDARKHLSFGKGIHFCLGAALARLEAKIVFEELTRQAPSLTMVNQTLDYPALLSFRGPRSLAVEIPAEIAPGAIS